MKLITAIVHKEDARPLNRALVEAGFSATQLATTGGFLLAANVTFLVGVQDNRVDDCVAVFARHSHTRSEMMPGNAEFEPGAAVPPLAVTVGGATIFVTNVERFEKV